MIEKTCSYEKCRNEALLDNQYCKYHKRLVDIENQGPHWLNEMIKEMKKKKIESEAMDSEKEFKT